MPNQNTGSGQLARQSQPRHDLSFKVLEAHIERDALGELLGVSDDERVMRLVAMLLSPDKTIQRHSLAKLAQMCDLSYAELLRTISQARVSEGVLRMSKKVPDVMASVAENACNRFETCKFCKGTGEIPDTRKGKEDQYRKCGACAGDGKIFKTGDISAQKVVFETIGLTNRKSPLFNINVNGDRPGELPSVEAEMGGMGKVLDVRPAKGA